MALEVQIGADSTDFNNKIKEIEKDIQDLSKIKLDRIKLGLDTKEIDGNIKSAKQALSNLKTSLNDSGTAFNNHSKSVANGGNTLMQFSRIAQDAPFGIMGIGNNLTATAEAFGNLSKSSGGAGNALKAVASSIMGTGGILLAVSLVTTAFTVMSQQGLTISDVFNKLSGNFDAFGSTLKQVSQEATKSALEETGALKGLIAIAQDETQTKKMRLEAVDQLQKTYPNYFGNLSKEQIMYGDLKGVVDDVTKSLINKAIAEKMSEKAAEPTLKLWEANARLIKQREEATKAEAAFQKAASNGAAGNSMQFYATQSARAAERLQETRNEVIALNKEVSKYNNVIEMASKAGAKTILTPGASAKAKKVKPAQVRTNPVIENNLKAADLVGLNDKEFQLAKDRIGRDGELIKTYGKAGVFVQANLKASKEAVSKETIEMLTLMATFNDNVNQIIGESIASTFSNLGTVIGDALASGASVLDAVGASLLQSLGNLLSSLGDELIKLGTAAVLAGTVVKLFGTIAGVGAGLAAIAGGVLLKGIGGAIASKGNKNANAAAGNNNNVSSGADVSSPQSSVSSGGTFNNSSGTVVFEIAGQKLIGVLNNTLGANTRLGGNLAIG